MSNFLNFISVCVCPSPSSVLSQNFGAMEPISAQVISDLKACLKLMQSDPYIPTGFCPNFCQKSRPKSDRFLVNLFEKPLDSKVSLVKSKQKEGQSDNVRKNIDWKRSAMEEYAILQSQRDVECLKMKEASNIIHFLDKNVPYGCWQERLLAESVLLATGERLKLLKNKIRGDCSGDVTIGTVSLTNFKFTLPKQITKSDETEFFVLLLSNENEVRVSNVARCVSGVVEFDEKFVFPIGRSFRIKVQLHCLTMKETPKFLALGKFLKRATARKNPVLKLHFRNLNTCDFEETKVLKSGFKLCAETEVVPSTFHNKAWKLNSLQHPFLNEFVTFSTNVERFKIEYRQSGFLTLGQHTKGGVVWNRRWCLLDGQFLKVYGSPSEDAFEALVVLDLAKCPSVKIEEASRVLCNRPKSFIVEVDKEKHYFMADNGEDLKTWLSSVNLILEILRFKASFKF